MVYVLIEGHGLLFAFQICLCAFTKVKQHSTGWPLLLATTHAFISVLFLLCLFVYVCVWVCVCTCSGNSCPLLQKRQGPCRVPNLSPSQAGLVIQWSPPKRRLSFTLYPYTHTHTSHSCHPSHRKKKPCPTNRNQWLPNPTGEPALKQSHSVTC